MPRYARHHIDLQAELARMQVAAQVRIGYEAQWYRAHSGGQGGSSLAGPFGIMLAQEIRKVFSSGPTPDIVDQNNQVIGKESPLRWRQLEALTDPAYNPKHQAARQLAVLYRNGLKVSGEIASPAWNFLEARACIDRAMLRKQSLEIMQGSIALIPTFRQWGPGQYYPPSLDIVYPDECIAIRDPANPGRASIFIRLASIPVSKTSLQKRRVALVWDVSDPANPYYGQWPSLENWQSGADPTYSGGFILEGADYPWYWQGAAIMPIACSQWDPSSDELLPSSQSEHQEMLDIIRARTWCAHVAHSGSFQRSILMSDSGVDGLNQSMIDPTVLLNVFGPGAKSIATMPDSTESAQRLWAMWGDRVLEWARRYDTGFEVRDTGSAKSGAAIVLEMTGKDVLAQQLETRARPVDEHAIQGLAATYNYLIRSGQLSVSSDGATLRWTPNAPATISHDVMIPEGQIDLAYPRSWSSLERKDIRAGLVIAVDRGDEDARAIWLLDRGLDDDRGRNGQPDGPNWLSADEAIRSNLASASSYSALGYGLNWSQRAAVARQTVDAEETRHDPPADVATLAAKGLQLRDEFPGRALSGLSAQNTRLLRRARGLREQLPMLVGEVRALAAWLTAHENDADVVADVGDWGNDSAPSGPYITWLTQGAESARAWVDGILAVEPQEVPNAV